MAFSHSYIYDMYNIMKINSNPYLKRLINNNVTEAFLFDLFERLSNEMNFIIRIFGATGLGKSTIAQYIYFETMRFLGKKTSLKDIVFSRTEMMQRLKEIKPPHVIIIDEDERSRFGLGSAYEEEFRKTIERIVRAEQICFIFCSPDVYYSGVEHFLIEAFDIDKKKKLNRSILYLKAQLSNVISYEPIGVLKTKYTYIDGYLEKKLKFIEEMRKLETPEREKLRWKYAFEIFDNYRLHQNISRHQLLQLVKLKYSDIKVIAEQEDIVEKIKFLIQFRDTEEVEKLRREIFE